MRVLFAVILAAVILTALAPSPAQARFGAGLMVGEPTGFTFKWWQDESTAVNAATGWSLGDGHFYAHGDYVWHRVIQDEKLGGSAPVYYGIGARLLLGDGKDKVGVRIPLGVNYTFEDGRFDVFVEIAPIFNVIPETSFGLSGGVGARFYF
jgi:hypothetical protein